jgi:hypothetical protein
LKRILIKSWKNFTRIPWSFNSSRTQKSFEWMDTKAGYQNSDWNSWNISSEFCGHLIIWLFKLEFLTNNFIVIWIVGHQNSDQNASKISKEFCGQLLSGPQFYNKTSVIFQLKFYKIPISGLMAENPFGLVFNNFWRWVFKESLL